MGEPSNSFWNRASTFLLVIAYAIGFGLYQAQKVNFPIVSPDIIAFLVGCLAMPIGGGTIGLIVSVVLDLAARRPIRPLVGFNLVVAVLITVLIAGEILDFAVTRR